MALSALGQWLAWRRRVTWPGEESSLAYQLESGNGVSQRNKILHRNHHQYCMTLEVTVAAMAAVKTGWRAEIENEGGSAMKYLAASCVANSFARHGEEFSDGWQLSKNISNEHQ